MVTRIAPKAVSVAKSMKSQEFEAPKPAPKPVFPDGVSSSVKSAQAKLLGAQQTPRVDGAGPNWPAGPLVPNKQTNPDVLTMQNRLVQLGYMTADELKGGEGIYGRKTTAAVREFQVANGIRPVTGLADEVTLRAMGASSAKTVDQVLGSMGETRIGDSIGTAGPAPVPTVESLNLPPPTGTITGSANVRPTPGTEGAPLGQFAKGTEVSIVQPQPADAKPGWVYVSGKNAKGEALTGWVADGVNGIDLVKQNAVPTDPRVQARMEELGYVPPGGAVDDKALRNFQLMNGLEPSGTYDDATLAKMWSADATVSNHLRQVKDTTWNHSSDAPSRSNNCGPTSVAMAAAAAGLIDLDNGDPQEAIDQMRKAAGGGNGDRTGPSDLIDGVKSVGGEAYEVKSMDEVKLALANGDPVVLFGNTYGGHWVTVQGYDPATKTWLVSDPMSKDGVARWDEAKMNAYANFSVSSVAVHNPAHD